MVGTQKADIGLVAELERFDPKFSRLGWVSFLLSPGFSAHAGGGKFKLRRLVKRLDLCLALQSLTSCRVGFRIKQLKRRAASGVFRPPAVFVFIDTVVEVVGDTGVKRLIGALQNIDNPV